MDYKSLISIVKKNNLNDYLSVLKGHTMYDKKYALFYLDKRDLLCRLIYYVGYFLAFTTNMLFLKMAI